MSDISTAIPIDRIRSLIEMHDRKMAAADDASQKIIIIGNDGDIALNILRGIIKALTTRLAPDRKTIERARKTAECLADELESWLELGPDKQPHFPESRIRPFNTGDLKAHIEAIRVLAALTPATAPDREAIARAVYDYQIGMGLAPEDAAQDADGITDAILSLMGEG